MSTILSAKFKQPNPYRPDETITQEVIISDTPTLDYSHCDWVAIDTEFLGLNIEHSQLCVVQIASPGVDFTAENPHQRIEIIWVWQKIKEQDNELRRFFAQMLEREDLEMIMHVSTADLPRLELLANSSLRGKLFDTKAAAKVVLTSTSNYGMEDLITNMINPSFQKNKTETGSQWDLHPLSWTDKMAEYAMNDVYYLHALKLNLEKIAQRRGAEELLATTMKAMPAVCQLYKHGYSVSVFTY